MTDDLLISAIDQELTETFGFDATIVYTLAIPGFPTRVDTEGDQQARDIVETIIRRHYPEFQQSSKFSDGP